MAHIVPRDLDVELSTTAQTREETLYLMATLQVRIDVLRRAQTLAPEIAEELQATIDEIQQQLRDLD